MISKNEVMERLRNKKFDDLSQLQLQVDAYRLELRHRFDPVSVVAIGKIDPLPHQVEAFVKMMSMLRSQSGIEGRIRMLMADDVGLGKTIMIGLLVKELLIRKKIRRVLIVSPSGLQVQWAEELSEKFNEKFEIVQGDVRNGNNPYKINEKVIISVDTGRNNPEKRELLMSVTWDLVVFDEAHKLKPGTLRHQLAKDLAIRTKHMILASATPHDGKLENFLALVKLIDEELEYNANPDELRRYLEPLMIRRLKEEIVDFRGRKVFSKRDPPQTVQVAYTTSEREFYDRVEDYVSTYYKKAEDSHNTIAILALYILHRRVSSSIRAGLLSLKKRRFKLLEPYLDPKADIKYFDYVDDGDEEKREKAEEALLGATSSTGDDLKQELSDLYDLIEMGEKLVNSDQDSKLGSFMEQILDLRKNQPDDKIIVFTEFTDTLAFLERKLVEAGFIVAKIHGQMTNEEKKEQAKIFETAAHILLGTEAAGEGHNLQFANIVINYELPWNPNRLEQRIGRVHRYGQKKKVLVCNLKTAFPIDDAILKKIREKLDNIRSIFGDSAINVIGSMISEREILEIFRMARTAGAAMDKVDEVFDAKTRVLSEIDQFFIKERFNLMNVTQLTNGIENCVNNFDVERFFLSYLSQKQSADYMPVGNGMYHISIPEINATGADCVGLEEIKLGPFDFVATFDVKKRNGRYVALGHPSLEGAIADCIRQSPVSIVPFEEPGVLFTYIIRFFNGNGQMIYAEPLLLLNTESGIKFENPLFIWQLQHGSSHITIQTLKAEIDTNDYVKYIDEVLSDPLGLIKPAVCTAEEFVRSKNIKDLEREYNFLWSEYDWKIRSQNRKIDEHLSKGQNYLIPQIKKRIAELRAEWLGISQSHLKARNISWDICGPINLAILVPYSKVSSQSSDESLKYLNPEQREAFEKAKTEVERVGMELVVNYEKDQGRIPVDVSKETWRGYDIRSSSDNQTRYIEVKTLARELASDNPIEISSNEWRVSSQLQDDYYLYVVQNAHVKPELRIVRNPYENLEGLITKRVVEDYKIVLDKLPNELTCEKSDEA